MAGSEENHWYHGPYLYSDIKASLGLSGQGASSSYTEHSIGLVRPRSSAQSYLLGYRAQPQVRPDGWKGFQTNSAS